MKTFSPSTIVLVSGILKLSLTSYLIDISKNEPGSIYPEKLSILILVAKDLVSLLILLENESTYPL